jgi:hypothetical protein
MGERRGAYRASVRKPEGRRPLGKLQEGTDWIDLAQDRDRWQALLNTLMNLRVP